MELAHTKPALPQERLLIRELTHRISNEFTSVVNMVALATARAASAEAKDTLEAVMNRLDAYVRVHRALQMPEPGERIDASTYLRELCRSLSRSKLDEKNIDLVFVERPLPLNSEQCWLLCMIVYELVNNAARHAFDAAGGQIRVDVSRAGGFVECRVSDDGNAPYLARRGRGLTIIGELASHLDGTFDQQFRAGGSASRVTFPVWQIGG